MQQNETKWILSLPLMWYDIIMFQSITCYDRETENKARSEKNKKYINYSNLEFSFGKYRDIRVCLKFMNRKRLSMRKRIKDTINKRIYSRHNFVQIAG